MESTLFDAAPEDEATNTSNINNTTLNFLFDGRQIAIPNPNENIITIDSIQYSATCIAYLQSILSHDELSSAIVHCRISVENTASDNWGNENEFAGWEQRNSDAPITNPPSSTFAPTKFPTRMPTSSPLVPTASPTVSYPPTGSEPTYHPTLHDKLFVLRGTVYYDRNANGSRDANVDTEEYGGDTEYNIGLGGVNLQLVECDLATNRAVVVDDLAGDVDVVNSENEEEGWNSYSSTISQGYDVLFHPTLADRSVDGGKFNMINIKVNRAYYIQAEAPAGYLFTGGVCNDSIPGWTCPTPKNSGVVVPSMKSLHEHRLSYANRFEHNGGEDALGLRVGRSSKCVSVDRTGRVNGNLDLGVMKVGDVKLDKTEVQMKLNLDDVDGSVDAILESMKEAGHVKESESAVVEGEKRKTRMRSLLESLVVRRDTTTNRVLIKEEDQYAIGVIAAEVLASSLDRNLASMNVELDHITAKEVVVSIGPNAGSSASAFASDTTKDPDSASDFASGKDGRLLLRTLQGTERPGGGQSAYTNSRNPAPRRQNRLTIDLEVWGHYPPSLNVDFDHIVQDSINRETEMIRAELQEYNTNCDDQIEKVDDHGFVIDDFEEIHSNKGVVSNTRLKRERNAQNTNENNVVGEEDLSVGGVFRVACSNEIKLPEYFEKSLETIEITKIETVIMQEPSETPVMIIAVLASLMVVVLIGGFLVFRMGFKKTPVEEELDGYSDYDEESKSYYTTQSKGTLSVNTKGLGDAKTEGAELPAPISTRSTNVVGRRVSRLFKFGKKSIQSETSEDAHENFAQGRKSKQPMAKTLDKSDSTVESTKVLDDDHVDADKRIKDFERRMKVMQQSMIQKKSMIQQKIMEEDEYDESTDSSRPTLPGNIKFIHSSGSTGEASSSDGSTNSSSSDDSSVPVKSRKKTRGKKKRQMS